VVYEEKIKTTTISGFFPQSAENFKDSYILADILYNNPLSPSIIYSAKDTQGNQFAVKQVKKERLSQTYLFDFARNEMVIQQSLSRLSNNIVKVPDYYEDDEHFTMVMEYSEDPCYFEELLENVNYLLI
jgi:hypothetical protein